MKDIIILAGARDYHAMDWYRAVKKLGKNRKVKVLTDLIDSEGYDVIVQEEDIIDKIFIIDSFLFKKQSKVGNFWRNFFKLLIVPVQVFFLKKYARKNPNAVFHAQPMYYMLLCWIARIEFIGTPQGSEILVRSVHSRIYRYFARRVLKAAKYVTVDSVSMMLKIKEISGVDALLIQNGIELIDVDDFLDQKRTEVTSIRGMTDLYRIKNILDARNQCEPSFPINFIYPFLEEGYHNEISQRMLNIDQDLGRLDKRKMFDLLSRSYLVISIPKSDSSPRSVYESIFMGCILAVTKNTYLDILPDCMKERIFEVNLDDNNWLVKANLFAKEKIKTRYAPSEEAINMFDQNKTMLSAIDKIYR